MWTAAHNSHLEVHNAPFLLFQLMIMNASVVLFETSLNAISSLSFLSEPRPRQSRSLKSLPARLRLCNETLLHCLSQPSAWQRRNATLILSVACLLPPDSKPMLYFSFPERVCRHFFTRSQTALRLINYFVCAAFRALRRNYDDECNQECWNQYIYISNKSLRIFATYFPAVASIQKLYLQSVHQF